MLRSIWNDSLELMLKQRNWAIAFALVMLISNVLLGIKIFYGQERVIIVPAYIKKSFWVEGESISKEYLEEMTMFFANLVLNVTPESIDYQSDVVLKYVSPEFHNIFYQRLLEEGQRLKKESLSTSFRPQEIIADNTKGEVIITGILTQYVGDKKAGQVKESYKATYVYSNGILMLNGFEVVDEKE